MPRTLISLGANLGNVRETMKLAQQMLQDEFGDGELRFSRLYRTPPVGGPSGQGDFLNGIAALDSSLDVWQIWESVKRVETGLGRHRMHRWEARRIDVDVLLHDESRIWTPHFKVPHPRMCMRSFMLFPALEVAANWVEPVSGWTIQQLANNLLANGPIAVLVPDNKLKDALESRITKPEIADQLLWIEVPSPSDLVNELQRRSQLSEQLLAAKLTIVAVNNQDPETVQWEDWSRTWAETLGMSETGLTLRPKHSKGDPLSQSESNQHGFIQERLLPKTIGPRYLLPANDVDWAAHEIASAFEAMHCSIEVFE